MVVAVDCMDDENRKQEKEDLYMDTKMDVDNSDNRLESAMRRRRRRDCLPYSSKTIAAFWVVMVLLLMRVTTLSLMLALMLRCC